MKKLIIIFALALFMDLNPTSASITKKEAKTKTEIICNSAEEFPKMEEETYIDDIPFDTKTIFYNNIIKLEEEKSIDDIPFDTKTIFYNNIIKLEEEKSIDDIPFDTKQVIRNMK